MTYALTNCTIYTGFEVLSDHALIIRGERIRAIAPTSALPPVDSCIDLQGAYLSPGFIDLQLNGCGGVMFNDAIAPATLDTMHQTNLRSGTTGFLPTLITTSDEAMHQAMNVVRDYRQRHPQRVLGLHLEGPYLNPKRKGIHNGKYVRSPDPAMIDAIIQAGPDTVRLMTLAPELVPPKTLGRLKHAGITIAAGHTNATYDQAMASFAHGVTMVTHLFNAMSPWQSRQPGMVGAALQSPQVYTGIIADGHHVHFASIALARQLKGDLVFLVTDATPPAGTTMDAFVIGGQEVYYRDGRCVSADGTLGGSALTMIEAIANCVNHVGISLAEALRMATLYPARAIGLAEQLGHLSANAIANIAIFNDDFKIVGVVDQGHFQSFASQSPVPTSTTALPTPN